MKRRRGRVKKIWAVGGAFEYLNKERLSISEWSRCFNTPKNSNHYIYTRVRHRTFSLIQTINLVIPLFVFFLPFPSPTLLAEQISAPPFKRGEKLVSLLKFISQTKRFFSFFPGAFWENNQGNFGWRDGLSRKKVSCGKFGCADLWSFRLN